MKYTLLELTQLLLNDLDGDQVDSITDTAEATQVANIILETYNDIISRADLPEHYNLFELQASGDVTLPIIMYLPSGVVSLLWIKYNNETDDTPSPYYKEVCYQDLDSFMNTMLSLDPDEDNIDTTTLTIGSDSIPLIYQTDKFPQYFTTFNDNTLIFDSFNSDEDATLQKTKTIAYGLTETDSELSDGFIPDLDSHQFALLIADAKSQAFIELKQVENVKAERRARKQWIHLQKSKRAVRPNIPEIDKIIGYGRK